MVYVSWLVALSGFGFMSALDEINKAVQLFGCIGPRVVSCFKSHFTLSGRVVSFVDAAFKMG